MRKVGYKLVLTLAAVAQQDTCRDNRKVPIVMEVSGPFLSARMEKEPNELYSDTADVQKGLGVYPTCEELVS